MEDTGGNPRRHKQRNDRLDTLDRRKTIPAGKIDKLLFDDVEKRIASLHETLHLLLGRLPAQSLPRARPKRLTPKGEDLPLIHI